VCVAFIHEPLISGEAIDVPFDKLTKIETMMDSPTEFKFLYECFSDNYAEQRAKRDPNIYPGWMPEDELAKMPMTFMMTGEFEYMRRDTFAFAKRLESVNKLAGVSDVAGVGHDWAFIGNIPRIESFYKEWQSAFEAYTGPK
jgi:acetyl esterase/lipase